LLDYDKSPRIEVADKGKKTPSRLVQVEVTAGDGTGSIDNITFDGDDIVSVDPKNLLEIVKLPKPAPFSLNANEARKFTVEVIGRKNGKLAITSTARGKGPDGDVSNSDTAKYSVGVSDLSAEILVTSPDPTQSVDALRFEQLEDGSIRPIPLDFELVIKNTGGDTLENLKIPDQLDIASQNPNKAPTKWSDIAVEIPTPTKWIVDKTSPLKPDEKRTAGKWRWEMKADLPVDFRALVSATNSEAGPRSQNFLAIKRLQVGIEKKFSFKTKVANAEKLVTAGNRIVLTGTLKNLSYLDALTVGPPLPDVRGNAGRNYLYFVGPKAAELKQLELAELISLDPGESKEFRLEFRTTWVNPRSQGKGGGGTRAEFTFTPWADAINENGDATPLEDAQISASAADLRRLVSIDDSVPIPNFAKTNALASSLVAFTVGGIEGVKNFALSIPMLAYSLVEIPVSMLIAAADFQAKVWKELTPSERTVFANQMALIVSAKLLAKGYEGRKKPGELFDQVNKVALETMTDLQNEWETGDYTSVLQKYTAAGSETIAGILVPEALGSMLANPALAGKVTAAVARIQEEMAPLLARIPSLVELEEVIPLLEQIKSGTRLAPEYLAKLYGIDAQEAAELFQIAKESEVLMYMRSRHASSIEWIKRFNAVLKPEAIKIKCVNDVDTLIGYTASDVGRLIFKKPLALIEEERSGLSAQQWLDETMAAQGIAKTDNRYTEASGRLKARIEEWNEYEATYKEWSTRKYIDVGFNYRDNAIPSKLRSNSSSFRKFNMARIGEEEYVLEMADRFGALRTITGDIDGLMFTNLDGTPLSAEKHYKLLERLKKNTLINAQHGESATYVNGGVDFIAKNLKGEPPILFTPDGEAIVVKFNKKESVWNNPFDYTLRFDGTPIHFGGQAVEGAISPPVLNLAKRPKKSPAKPKVFVKR
jgi:hypothetical protein